MSNRSFVEEEIAREKRTSPGIEIPSLCDRVREAWRRCRLPDSAVDAARKISNAIAYERAKAMGLAVDYKESEVVYPTIADDPQFAEEMINPTIAEIYRRIVLAADQNEKESKK